MIGRIVKIIGAVLVFSVLGMAGVAMGLLLSACVTSPDRANALLPYVLIPQMILGGGFISVSGPLFWVAAAAARNVLRLGFVITFALVVEVSLCGSGIFGRDESCFGIDA